MPFTNAGPSQTSAEFQQSFLGLSSLENAKVIDCHLNPNASGYQMGYMVPAGKFALGNRFFSFNPTLGSISAAPVHSGSNTFFRIGAATESTVTSNSVASTHTCLTLGVPGDCFGYYTTGSGLNCYMSILEIPSGSLRVMYKNDNFSSGTSLIGTAGNNGTMVLTHLGAILNTNTNGSLNFSNASNRTVAYTVYLVPPGESASTHNIIARGTAGHFLRVGLTLPNYIGSGTSIYLYVDGSGAMSASVIGADL
jgi:hypothetical protein